MRGDDEGNYSGMKLMMGYQNEDYDGENPSMIRIDVIKEDHDEDKVTDNRDNLRNEDKCYEDDGNIATKDSRDDTCDHFHY